MVEDRFDSQTEQTENSKYVAVDFKRRFVLSGVFDSWGECYDYIHSHFVTTSDVDIKEIL